MQNCMKNYQLYLIGTAVKYSFPELANEEQLFRLTVIIIIQSALGFHISLGFVMCSVHKIFKALFSELRILFPALAFFVLLC